MGLNKEVWGNVIKKQGGRVVYWICQEEQLGEDNMGVCFALTDRWLEDDVFAADFKGVITEEIVDSQKSYSGELAKIRNTLRSAQSSSDKFSLWLASQDLRMLQKSGERMEEDEILRNIHESGTHRITMFREGGAHVFGLRVAPGSFQLFDANGGLFLFDDLKIFKSILTIWLRRNYSGYPRKFLGSFSLFEQQNLERELEEMMAADLRDNSPDSTVSCWDAFLNLICCCRKRPATEFRDPEV